MSIFDFKKKQRLNAQLYGHTSGSEMFKVDEYNTRKKVTEAGVIFIVIMLSIFYFFWKDIPQKIIIWMIIITAISIVYCFFNFKQQKRLRERLYG